MRSEEKMKKVNFKKLVCGVSLGTVMALGSMSSVFAADINQPIDPAKKVELQQPAKSLTKEQAKADALQQYKGDVKDIQLTKENGKDVYVIVIHGQDGKDHTVKINAITSAAVDINQEQAKAIALQQYKGIVKDIQLTNENGKDVYVIVIHGLNGKDQTVKIDAITGAIVKFTQNQVKDLALKQYKGTVKNIQLNNENGKEVYIISVHGQDGKDHDVKIDAKTGETL
jgi:uncharacterized membrane protein YkoI